MYRSIAAAAIAATSLAALPTAQERASVPSMESNMRAFGRDQNYEIYKTTTGDGFVLTLFRLLPKATPATKKGAILIQHGAGMDGTDWFNPLAYPDGNADTHTLFALADEGYDVFVGNNRATPYSNVHPKYPDADNPASPNYAAQNKAKYGSGMFEMGQYDVPANLNKVTEVAGVDKVTYIGYSQGTAQMFYALAVNDATVNAKVDRAIMMAPCMYVTDQADGKPRDFTLQGYDATIKVFEAENVNVFAGPNAAADLQKVCTPSSPDAYMADSRAIACQTMKVANNMKAMPIRSLKQFQQVSISSRHQQYVEDFNADTLEQPLLEPGIGEASLPIRLVVAPKDLTCPLTQAQRIMGEYGGEVNFTRIGADVGHSYFASAMQQPEFLAMLRDELTDTDFSSAFAVTAASAIIATITTLSF